MIVKHNSKVLALELSIVKKLAKAIDTPRALSVALLIENNEWSQLLDLSIDANHYENSSLFASDYLITSILSKNPRLPTLIDKRAVAIDKFHAAERSCAETNSRLSNFVSGQHPVDPELLSVLLSSQIEIQRILGPFPTSNDLEYMTEKMRFGPGATTSVTGIVTQGKKYSLREVEVTPRLLPFRAFCFPDLWKENAVEVLLQSSSRLAVVPKNAKTDRVVCIEPDLNIFVQLGTGALLRKKLLRSGLDLNTQDRNRLAAQKAYKCDLATVDLSSASDTISREAVWNLLPHSWAELLHLSRVDSTLIDGVVTPLHKWSSMGNGYTFELETLIFYGISLAVCKRLGLDTSDVTVYGDDIIVPASALDLLTRSLNFFGFKLNSEKTFGKGDFHESCGADYFRGQNVRPIYLRSELYDYESICYLYANNLRRWANRFHSGRACDSRILPAWLHCFTAVEPAHRYLVPEGFGDPGFIESFDRSTPNVSYSSRRKGWAGFNFRYRKLNSVKTVVSQKGAYFSALNGSTTDFSRGQESLRGRHRPPSTEIGYTIEWPNLGPWY